MTKQQWKEHIEQSVPGGMTLPWDGGDRETYRNWLCQHVPGCKECAARRRTRLANERAKARHQAYLAAGLVRVKGACGGVYYE